MNLQKLPLPSFDGNIEKYARFKTDFKEIVCSTLKGKEACFALRQCLSPDISKIIDTCENDLESMLTRLDEKFGDPSKLVDVIVSKILKFRKMEVGDDKQIIEFIDMLEYGYRDLKSLGMEMEISNANVVSIIESKLPRSVALEWFKEIHKSESKVVKSNKFPSLLEFLRVEGRVLEYGLSDT